jgi:hypothetical protein
MSKAVQTTSGFGMYDHPVSSSWRGKAMKQVPTFKVRKVTPLTDAQLLRRLIELKKLRERVHMAEVAMRPGANLTLARHR